MYKNNILEIRKHIPEKLCSKIIAYFDGQGEDAKTTEGFDKNIRNCKTGSLLYPKTFGESIVSNYVKQKIFEITEIYKGKFPFLNVKRISQIDLLKYEANEYEAGYVFHTDFGPKTTERCLSVSICLNNDFIGGEFLFKIGEEEIQYPQNVGDAIVFPSNFMFPHQVNKVTKGTRYAIVSWVV